MTFASTDLEVGDRAPVPKEAPLSERRLKEIRTRHQESSIECPTCENLLDDVDNVSRSSHQPAMEFSFLPCRLVCTSQKIRLKKMHTFQIRSSGQTIESSICRRGTDQYVRQGRRYRIRQRAPGFNGLDRYFDIAS